MPFRIAKTFTIESGHLLTKHPGACRYPHGHSRTIEVILTGDTLDARDMVCDFKAIKAAAADLIARFDHTFSLNTADPHFAELKAAYGDRIVPFENQDPTSEVLARELFRAIRDQLSALPPDVPYAIGPGVRLERIRLTETATSWAEYWE